MNFDERYKNLNEEQRLAVDTIDGPVLVIAGPGSGKTELLSMRTANILKKTDALPSSILCVTFTDNAATNMRKRLVEIIGKEAHKIAIHTFHSLGMEITAQYPEYFAGGRELSAADEVVKAEILEKIFDKLKFDNPLGQEHQERGYYHLKEVGKRIADLKKGGLKPRDYKSVVEQNAKFLEAVKDSVAEAFAERISKKGLDKIGGLVEIFRNTEPCSLGKVLADSLAEALESGDTKPVTAWKNRYARDKNDKKENILRDYKNLPKHLALAEIYQQYQEKLTELGYYDYEDMILEAVEAMEKFPALRFTLQEHYQYLMVDEFQDTNGVQMRLINNLLDAQINEGRPNILAVGDDDQAIYKFQGANLENILNFHSKYRDPQIIVLTKNYRSSQAILGLVKGAIDQGKDRLVHRLPELSKELVAANQEAEGGEISEKTFLTSVHELDWVGNKIKELIANGHSAHDIAVITRLHNDLAEAASIFDILQIPVAYERKKNVLEEEHIAQLIDILRYVDSLVDKDMNNADYLLPKVLSFPFWEIPRVDIWKISVDASENRKMWLNVMQESENDKIREIANFLIALGVESKRLTVEQLIDVVIGTKTLDGVEFCSPYKDYYFSREKLEKTPNAYIDFMASLACFIQAVRKHRGSIALNVGDLLSFVALSEKHHLPVEYKDFFNDREKAVNLMTVHGAKGLEYKTVFVIGLQDDTWMKRHGRDTLVLPSNLPLMPEKDDEDDKLRLFYVALSRAKKNIYLSYHQQNEKGEEMVKLRFLSGENQEPQPVNEEEVKKLLEMQISLPTHDTRNPQENELLKTKLKNYKLSVTHLNNFLDIVNAGPAKFLENNLLRFPEMQSVSSAFGTAMHEAINGMYRDFKAAGKLPEVKTLLDHFQQSLLHRRLNRKDYERELAKGQDYLRKFYDQHRSRFHLNDNSEFNFRRQEVMIGDVPITGKIDKMKRNDTTREMIVCDFKTGKALKDWDSGDERMRLKAYKYRNQLIFYKLLVEGSRTFGERYTVKNGVLEFLEPDKDGNFVVLEMQITDEDRMEMIKLAQIVYEHIISLDFPDTSKYGSDFAGMLLFVEDLKAGRI